MQQPKRVLCTMDLSLAGRAGLAVVMPVLAACGVQACPLPTALFSTHTGGFGPVVRQDQADFCRQALEHFEREHIGFDGVYTGYLFGADQFALAARAMDQYPDAFHIVDPAMGDKGKLYSGLAPDTVGRMQKLCSKAQLITPNVTESALLLEEDPARDIDEGDILRRLQQLSAQGCAVLITSVRLGDSYQTYGCLPQGQGVFRIPWQHLPAHYPGTGDTFTAALCGLHLQQNLSLQKAAQKATDFVSRAVAITYQNEGEARSGLWLEAALPLLARENS